MERVTLKKENERLRRALRRIVKLAEHHGTVTQILSCPDSPIKLPEDTTITLTGTDGSLWKAREACGWGDEAKAIAEKALR